MRPISLGHSGAAGPRPITQSELATALALASTPDSSAVTPTTSSQVRICRCDGNILLLPRLSQWSRVVLLFSLPLWVFDSGRLLQQCGSDACRDPSQ